MAAWRARGDLLGGTALAVLVGCGLFAFSAPAAAQVSGVSGGVVVAGQATIANTAPGRVTVNQSSARGVIDWHSFSIGSGERVDFQQPSASAVTLNRVTGPDPSVIAGRLTATGQLILVNGAGIVFSSGSQVNAAGLIASTANVVDPQRFMQGGTIAFDRPSSNPNAGVVNAGTITVSDGGLVGLVGNTASNSGTINARMGRVTIGGAETFTVDLAGDGLINFQLGNPVSRQPVDAQGNKRPLAANTGTINADGGVVTLTARAARGVVDNVVNAGGTINARAVHNDGGVVVFGADEGTVNVTGTIDVSGAAPGQRGGQVVATAAKGAVNVAASARINASGASGGGTVLIGGGKQGQGPIANAKNTTVASGASINADATHQGHGGTVIVWADNATVFGGSISAKGGPQGGDGGFAEVSGKVFLDFNGLVDLRSARGTTGTLLLDPSDITISGGTDDTTQTGDTITGKSSASILNVDVLVNALKTANVVVDAAGGGGTGSGSITVATAITSTSGKNLTLLALADITLNADVNIGGGSLAFKSAGGALAGTGGAVTAAAVTLAMGGSVTLDNAANNFGVIGGTSGGAITVLNNGALTINAITAANAASFTTSGGGSITVAGTLAATGGVTLNAAGALTGAGAISSSGAVSLKAAASGGISLSGAITGTSMTVTSAAGGVTLGSADNVFGSFTTTATVGGAISVVHKGALTISAADAGTASASFTTNTGGDIAVTGALTAKGGVTLNAAGALTGAGAISSSGAVSLTAVGGGIDLSGAITGTSMTVTSAAGGVTLSSAGNAFGSFTTTATVGGAISVVHKGTLTIGTADAGTASASFTTNTGGDIAVSGALTAQSGVTLNAAGALTGAGAISSSGAVSLTAVGSGGINLSGAITGTSMTVTSAGGGVTLGSADNAFGSFTTTATVGGTINVVHKGTLQISAADVGTASASFTTNTGGDIALAGTLTAQGGVTLKAAGALTGAGAISSSGAVSLTAGGSGGIDLGGTITGTGVTVASAGGVTLSSTSNAFGQFSATGAIAGDVAVSHGGALTINSVDAGASAAIFKTIGSGDITVAGALTATGGITLTAAGAVAVNAALDATGAIVALSGTAITQTSSGAITASGLAATATAGSIDLTQAASAVITLAAKADAGSIGFKASGALVIGSVDGLGGITAQANIQLSAGGTITQSNAVNAAGLAVTTTAGDVTLTDAGNSFGTVAAKSAGAVTLQQTGGITVGVVGAVGALVALNGVTASADVVLTTSGVLAVNAAINAAGADVTLSGTAITQTGSGAITASGLAATASTGSIDLTQAASTVTTLAAEAKAGSIGFKASDALAIGTVGTLDGVTAQANVQLSAGGAVTQSKAVTATGLAIRTTAGGVTLTDGGNSFGTLAASSAGGVTLQQTGGITVGSVAAVGALGTLSGISTAAAASVSLTTGGALTINAAINASSASVALSGTSVMQAAGGVISAGSLAATATAGNIDLDQATNATATFAASAAAGTVSFKASSSFSIGSVAGIDGITATATTLVTTGGSISQTKAINTGTLDISTAGSAAVDLSNGGNLIDSVRSSGGLGGGDFAVSDSAGGLNVGGISGTGAITITTTGGGDVIVNAPLNASTVTLRAGGSITATAGAITASILSLQTGALGSADVEMAAHDVGIVQTTGTGVGSGGLTFSQSRAAGTTSGAIVSTGDVTIANGGGVLTVGGQINVGGGTLTLSAKNAITENFGAGITAGALLAVSTSGTIDLRNGTNTVGTFAASAAAGSVLYRSVGTFTVGTVGATEGITTSSGGFVDLRVASVGDTINAVGKITTGSLNITTSGGDVTLDNDNNSIGGLGAVSLGAGKFTFVNNAGTVLNIGGNVSADGGIDITNRGAIATTAAISSIGDISLTSITGQVQLGGAVTSTNGSIALHSNSTLDTGGSLISAATGDVTLISDAGTVTIGGGGVLVGNTLTIKIAPLLALAVTGDIVAPRIELIADIITIGAKVGDAATTDITLGPVSIGRPIALGGIGAAVGALTLDDGALAFLSPGANLTIGNATAGTITVRGATIANSKLSLITGVGVKQTGLLSIGGGTGTLSISAGGTVDLTGPGVEVSQIGGGSSGGAFDVVVSAPGGLTVNAITNSGGDVVVVNSFGGISVAGALSSNGQNIAVLAQQGALVINAAITAAGASVGLQGASGITQGGAGIITAANLLATTTGAFGADITLNSANAVSGNVTLNARGGDVGFTNTVAFTVGGIASIPYPLFGTLFADGGSGIRTFVNGVTTLTIGGNVTQAVGATDIISTGTLTISGNGSASVTLDNAANSVSFLGTVALGSGAFTLADTGGLTITGAGTAGGGYAVSTKGSLTQNGLAAVSTSSGNGAIVLTAGGSVSLSGIVNAGTGTVTLEAGVNVAQNGGAIAAASVDARAQGSISLGSVTNAFGVITGAGKLGFSAVTAQALTIGAAGVGSASGSVSLTTMGVGKDITMAGQISAGGAASLSASGDITVADRIMAATVSLQAAGSIVDTATGGIVATSLRAVAAGGSVDLSNAAASHSVGTIAGSALGDFTYIDDNTAALTVGTVTTVGVTSITGNVTIKALSGSLNVNSIISATAAGGGVMLQSNGDLSLSAGVAGSSINGRVTLASNLGSIVERTGGTIAAAELVATAATNVDLAQSNAVGAKGFAAVATKGFVAFANNGAIELDAVGGVNGITAGGAVAIVSTSGNITQTANGIVTAGDGLLLRALAGSIALGQANAIVGDFAIGASGDITIRNSGSINVGTVGLVGTVGGINTFSGVSSGAGRFVALASDTGMITQGAGGAEGILTGELRAQTAGADIFLTNAANSIDTLGSVGGGQIAVVDSKGGLTVTGPVTAGSGVALTTQGGDLTVLGSISTTGGNISLTSLANVISLGSALSAANGQVELVANKGGSITQTAGTITAQSLIALASSGVELIQAGNDVVTIAGSSGTGTFRYRDASAVAIGALTGTGGGVTGVSSSGKDITIVAGAGGAVGGIAVDAIVNAGSGTVRLQTGFGDITQATKAAITAGALLANAADGSVDLGGSTNAVASVAGAALGSTFTLVDAGGVTVTAVAGDSLTAGAIGIIANNGDVVLRSSGAIVLNSTVNAANGSPVGGVGAGSITLEAIGGSISQAATAAIVGASLHAVASGAGFGVTLNAATNAFGTITGSGTAGFSVTSSQTLAVGAAGVSSAAGPVSLTAAGAGSDLNVTGLVQATAGAVSLIAGGSIADAASGGVVAQGLQAVAVTGSVDLSAAAANHSVGTLAGSAGGSFTYASTSATALAIGTVAGTVGIASANGSVTVAATGSTLSVNQAVSAVSAGGSVSLTANGNLSLAAAVSANAGSGTLSLTSTAGSIVSTAPAGIVAGNRAVLRAGVNVDLARAGNAVGAGGLAGTASGGFFVVSSGTVLHIDTVGGTAGITSQGATILTAGAGSVTQSATGTITAGGGLGVRADGGDVVLDQANTVAGNVFASAVNGSVTFHNSGTVNVGAVSAATVSAGLVQGNGITASIASGRIVSLRSDNGVIGQDAAAGARIVGGELRVVTSNREVTLVNTSNEIEAVGNSNLGDGKLTVFDSTGGLTLSAPVIADGGVILTTLGSFTLPGSIVVAHGDISLTSLTAGISLGSTLSAVNGQVQLVAGGGGAITQLGGTITARSLIVLAPGDIELTQAGNDVGIVAGASAAGTFRYRDATAATIGTLVDSTGAAVSGITTANRDITIVGADGGVSGGIAINAAINAGTGTVRLQTARGDIAQAANAPITAAAVMANALDGSVNLSGSTNTVGIIAGVALGSTFTFLTNQDVLVTSVGGDMITITSTGIVTRNGDIVLQSSGGIAVNGTLNAANGNATGGPGTGNVTLIAAGGSVSQGATAAVVGDSLRVEAAGSVDLAAAGNDVARLAGIAATGTFRYRNASALVIDTIDGRSGVTTNDRDIGIHAGGNLTLNQAVDARGAASATTAVVRLQATNGNITQGVAGNVIGGTLLANTVGSGDIVLTNRTNLLQSGAGNIAGNPGFVAGTASGNFRFINGGDLTVSGVAVDGNAGLGINGAAGVTAGTGRLVGLGVSAGDLSILGPVSADAGMILYRRTAGAPIGDITIGGPGNNLGNGVGGAWLLVADLTGSSSLALTGLTESGAGAIGAPTGLFTTPTPPTTLVPAGLGGPNGGGELTIGAIQGINTTIYLVGGATSGMTSSAPGFFGVLGVYAQEGARVNLQSIVRAIPNTTVRPIGPFGPNDPGPVGTPPDVVARDFVRKSGLPSINQRFNNCVIAGPSCTTIYTQIANPPTTADDAVIGIAGSSLDDSSIILVNQGNEEFIEDDDERRRAEKR